LPLYSDDLGSTTILYVDVDDARVGEIAKTTFVGEDVWWWKGTWPEKGFGDGGWTDADV
jgi:hypothetical protein